MENKIVKYLETLSCIKECLVDYSTPIYIKGNIEDLEPLATSIVSAKISKKELIILNNKIPEWLNKLLNNTESENNILIIKDFDKIKLEEQNLFIDIICENQISSVSLPENLKIIINSSEKCKLITKISDIIQYFEI